MRNRHVCCFLFLALFFILFRGYALPRVNLGETSFLDGGPLRQKPGWYLQEYTRIYHATRFLNGEGELVGGIPSPTYNDLLASFQGIYQSLTQVVPKGRLGCSATLPFVLYSKVQKNTIGITDSGSGLADISAGLFIQWDTIFHENGDPFFVHRLEFDAGFPTGKNKGASYNPGSGTYYITPYWAATLYFTPRLAASWRAYYVWSGANHTTHVQAGQAIDIDFAVSYAFLPQQLFLGLNGYALLQFQDNKLAGIPIADSKERVIGLGIGGMYAFDPDLNFDIFGNFYWEFAVRNRPQGIRAVLRFFKHF